MFRPSSVVITCLITVWAGSAGASTYYCNAAPTTALKHGYDDGCVPAFAQAVQKDSLAIGFRLKDADASTAAAPVAVWAVLYENAAGDTYQDITKYARTSVTNTGFRTVNFTGLKATNTYAFNVYVCKNPIAPCAVAPPASSSSGGQWFNTRREVVTAPAGRGVDMVIDILGDTRDSGQGACTGGYIGGTHGTPCGGNDTQRSNYGDAVVAAYGNLIVHTGDIGSSSSTAHLVEYFNTIGNAFSQTFKVGMPTLFAFGNHEMSSPGGPNSGDSGEQDYYGTSGDTLADDMIAVPSSPTSLQSPQYPGPIAQTYYSQNFGPVHIVVLNGAYCVMDGKGYPTFPPPKDHNGKTLPSTYDGSMGSNGTESCQTYSHNQRTWLKSDLAAANSDRNIDWIFVVQHYPFWSNGTNDTANTVMPGNPLQYINDPTDSWISPQAQKEYQSAGPIPYTSVAKAADGSLYNSIDLDHLDTILRHYNVDAFFASHAHYYERLADSRGRVSVGGVQDALPHIVIGGGGSAEQNYLCPGVVPGSYGCENPSAVGNNLPPFVSLQTAAQGQFYLGQLSFIYDVPASINQVTYYAVSIDDVNSSEKPIDELTLTSRKAQIRNNFGMGVDPAFDGCVNPHGTDYCTVR